MNMIIAGDGHTHIIHEDSLSFNAQNWNVNKPDCNLIMTNPQISNNLQLVRQKVNICFCKR